METGSDQRAPGQALKSEINITPLVDVMLVVLIIFIVVTPLLQQGVEVDLPAARHIEDAAVDETHALTVVVHEDGQIYVGADPIEDADLTALLQARHRLDPALPLQIKADRNIAYGEVKAILQAGRAAGFHGASLIARELTPSGRGD